MYCTTWIKRSSLVATLSLLLALPAFALELSDAKASGLVGEVATGYLAPVDSANASAEVNALVADINAKRKEHYRKIAQKNGISLEAVEVRAGQKAIEKSSSGDFVNDGSGWTKKP